jgi:hypothetical protein
MAADTELQDALAAGARFTPAIIKIAYSVESDTVTFATPWGDRVAKRGDIELLRTVPEDLMQKIYVSQVGIHIDDMDLDINSAGLLAALFPDLRSNLAKSR